MYKTKIAYVMDDPEDIYEAEVESESMPEWLNENGMFGWMHPDNVFLIPVSRIIYYESVLIRETPELSIINNSDMGDNT